jgi:hypothetical protein
MTEPSGRRQPADGQRPGASWEQRAAGLASEIQRWLIRTSARNMRDELGDQVKKAFRGSGEDAADPWATATTELPHAADEAPECAWCPLCRAARRIAQARAAAGSRSGPRLSDAADMMAGAMRDAFASLDSILSYRPDEQAQPSSASHPPAPPPSASPSSASPSSAQPSSASHPPVPEPPRPASRRPQPAAGGASADVPVVEPPEAPAVTPADDPGEST